MLIDSEFCLQVIESSFKKSEDYDKKHMGERFDQEGEREHPDHTTTYVGLAVTTIINVFFWTLTCYLGWRYK